MTLSPALPRPDGAAPASVHFTKMEARGNDFVLLVAAEGGPQDWPPMARALCARRWSIGADGLLVLSGGGSAPWRMRMFNPDGTEDMCGNGMRCIGVYLQTRGLLPAEGTELETLAGRRRIRPIAQGVIEADLGEPSLRPSDLPMAVEKNRAIDYPVEVNGERWLVTGVSMGTPHAVLFTEQPVTEEVFQRVSPALETHPLFPERTTVTWVCVESREALRVRFWERAVGESLSCGTGACAAVVAARVKGLVGDEVRVRMRGGELSVRWEGHGSVYKTGPAREVFEGEWRMATDVRRREGG